MTLISKTKSKNIHRCRHNLITIFLLEKLFLSMNFLKMAYIITKIRTIFLLHTNLWSEIFELSNKFIHLQHICKVIVLIMYWIFWNFSGHQIFFNFLSFFKCLKFEAIKPYLGFYFNLYYWSHHQKLCVYTNSQTQSKKIF